MKVTHEVDHLTGDVRVTAIWNVREQEHAQGQPYDHQNESLAADILADAERIVRKIDARRRSRSG